MSKANNGASLGFERELWQAADAIIGFLYRVHRQDLTRPRSVSMAYDDHTEFNDWIDEQSEPVQILSLHPYQPSDLLFNVDLEAYRDLLAEYDADVAAEDIVE